MEFIQAKPFRITQNYIMVGNSNVNIQLNMESNFNNNTTLSEIRKSLQKSIEDFNFINYNNKNILKDKESSINIKDLVTKKVIENISSLPILNKKGIISIIIANRKLP